LLNCDRDQVAQKPGDTEAVGLVADIQVIMRLHCVTDSFEVEDWLVELLPHPFDPVVLKEYLYRGEEFMMEIIYLFGR